MSKLTYSQILAGAAILAALPLDVIVKDKDKEEYTRSLETKLTARILSILANFKVKEKEYAALEEQLRNAVVPEDFQQRYEEYRQEMEKHTPKDYLEKLRAYQEARKADETYSDSEFEKVIEETNKKLREAHNPEIEKELEGYNSKYIVALKELQEQETEIAPELFSQEEFEKITEHSQGSSIIIKGVEVPRLHWLLDFSELLVTK